MSDDSGRQDPVFSTVDGLVRDGTLDHRQADRVYAAMHAGLPPERTGSSPGRSGRSEADRDVGAWSLAERLTVAAALLGSALALGAAGVGSFLADRFDDGFDVQPFLVALGTATALGAITAAVLVVVKDRDYSRWFVAGPAALAVLALALTSDIAFVDWEGASYLIGAVMVVGGAVVYVLARSGGAVAVVVLGGMILVGQFLSDVAPSGSDSLLWLSVPAVIYGVVVATVGWWLPTRHLTAFLGGVIALGGVLLVLVIGAFARALASALGDVDTPGTNAGSEYSGDSATTLVLGLIVCIGLLALYALAGHSRYAALGTGGTAAIMLTGLFALDLDHTLRWAGGIAVLGAAIAAGAALLPLSRHRRPRDRGQQAGPSQPGPSGYDTQTIPATPYPPAYPPTQSAPPYPSGPGGEPPTQQYPTGPPGPPPPPGQQPPPGQYPPPA